MSCTRVAPATDAAPVVLHPVSATVVVHNHHWADVRVYVALNGRKGVRLGIVPTMGAATFVLPHVIHIPNQLQLVAIPLGNDEPQLTPPILVDVGAKLIFTIEPAAPFSTLVKRE